MCFRKNEHKNALICVLGKMNIRIKEKRCIESPDVFGCVCAFRV